MSEQPAPPTNPRALAPPTNTRAQRDAVLLGLALLYTAQGVPFGIASDYLVVTLRRAHFSRFAIANTSWLQLPWQLKLLWSHLPDRPAIARRSSAVLLALQLGLALCTLLYAPFDLAHNFRVWCVLTAICALFAATQDVFVDALAVRALGDKDKGLGNSAQVGGYRVGMLVGGAGLLSLVGALGARVTFSACALLLVLTSVGAFLLRPRVEDVPRTEGAAPPINLRAVGGLVRDAFSRESRAVLAVALTIKIGIHMSSAIIKPMLVDFGWSNGRISAVVIIVGSIASVAGAILGGLAHRKLGERRALVLSMVAHAAASVALIPVALAHAPLWLGSVMITLEHAASSAGTTVLFAALMTATRPAYAGLHYTLLTSANNVALAVGSLCGSALADAAGEPATFAVGGVVSFLPLVWIRDWDRAARASSQREAQS